MGLLIQEALTRLIPFGQDEATYARNRLPAERPPWPRVGDRLYYRREAWDVDGQLHLMQVVDVQSPDDTTSEWATNLCQHLRGNENGQPLFRPDGSPVVVPLPDPLPWVHLRWPDELEIPKGSDHAWKYRIQMTFESRMRGSPGWLPLDYATTRVWYLSGQVPERQMPAYRYDYDTDRLQVLPEGGDRWLPYP